MATAATPSRPAVTSLGSMAVPAISVVPMRVSPMRPATSAKPNHAAPTISTRPGRRGDSQSGEAAQASVSAMRPIGMLR